MKFCCGSRLTDFATFPIIPYDFRSSLKPDYIEQGLPHDNVALLLLLGNRRTRHLHSLDLHEM